MSSFPRWVYAQQLSHDPTKKNGFFDEEPTSDSDEEFEYVSVDQNLRGVARAQRAFLNEARKILRGNHIMVEFFVNREPDAEYLRLEIWRSIVGSALYLSYKNQPFTTRIWIGVMVTKYIYILR